MVNTFSDNCLSFYGSICTYDNYDKTEFFDYCVNNRLNDLIEDNSKQLDYMLKKLEKYVDEIIIEKQPYERCSNYKERNKSNIKYNMLWIKRLFKKYNKSCISSAKLLSKIMLDLQEVS